MNTNKIVRQVKLLGAVVDTFKTRYDFVAYDYGYYYEDDYWEAVFSRDEDFEDVLVFTAKTRDELASQMINYEDNIYMS